jgi:hypothetical protein
VIFNGLIKRGAARHRDNFVPKHRTIYSTQGRYQRGLFHHCIEFKGFAMRRHLEERLVEGNFSGGRSDFFFRAAKQREAFE